MKQLTLLMILLTIVLITSCQKAVISKSTVNTNNTTSTNNGKLDIQAYATGNHNIMIGIANSSYDCTNNIFIETNGNPMISNGLAANWRFNTLTGGQTYYYKVIKTGTPDVIKSAPIIIIKDSIIGLQLDMN